MVLFPFQAVFTAAYLETLSMPKDSKKGELLLEAVKKEQTARLAARTALLVEQCVSPPEVVNLDQESSSTETLPGEETLWQRHTFNSGNLIIYARGEREAITIRKAPEGPNWFIDFGGPHYKRPK
jgi:hypothetical protein